jgi:hypothetical protein
MSSTLPKRRVTSHDLVELGYFCSIFAALRAEKRGEIPPGTWLGNRKTWDLEEVEAWVRARAGQPRPPARKRRKVIVA